MPDDNQAESAPDREYPDRLRITIASPAEAFDEAVEDAAAAEQGEQSEAVVSFESAEGVRQLLTDRRLELLESLMGEPGESITELAERLDRSYSVVHRDVEVLADCGIVKFRRDGQTKQPFVPYETIAFEVTVQAPLDIGESEAVA